MRAIVERLRWLARSGNGSNQVPGRRRAPGAVEHQAVGGDGIVKPSKVARLRRATFEGTVLINGEAVGSPIGR